MAGFHEFWNLSETIEVSGLCRHWNDSNFANLLFQLDFYTSPLILGSTFTATFFYWDLFFLAISSVIFSGLGINYLLTYLIQDYGPQGPDCFYGYQTPSYVTQLITEYAVLFVLLAIYRRYIPDIWTLFYIFFGFVMIVFERVYRQVDYPYQTLAGFGVGLVTGTLGFLIAFGILSKYGEQIEQWVPIQYFGIVNKLFAKQPPEEKEKKPSSQKRSKEHGLFGKRRDEEFLTAGYDAKFHGPAVMLAKAPTHERGTTEFKMKSALK